jgi:hypothetical protein
MLFGKTEHRRTHPYAAITIGTLAMIGAFSVVRCAKRTVRCTADKMMSIFKSKDRCDCSVDE